MAIFEDVKNALTNAAQSVSNMTKDSMELSRLNTESKNAATELNLVYTQVGRTYIDNDGNVGDVLNELVAHAKTLRSKIESLEQQKMALRNQNRCPSCGEVMSKSAKFCSNCGSRMPEPEPEVVEEPAAPADAVYCPSCGAMHKGPDAYCDICGFCFEAQTDTDAADDVVISAPIMAETVAEEECPDEGIEE